QMPDGTQRERNKGTPQGGVISPVLANLFLHYVFDKWLTLRYPGVPWCRYADDGLVHCVNKQQAEELRDKLAVRFQECGLELHPEKTKIVYLNLTLISWARKKYKTLRYRKTKACQLMERLSKEKPELFAHWKAGPESAFA
ncbi:hypothetical protein EYW98_23200, partial [Escherichia coli]|nr:hypothetical protein [Escherichia coli]EGO8379686.1 hypothetical protein [Escherichia coli]